MSTLHFSSRVCGSVNCGSIRSCGQSRCKKREQRQCIKGKAAAQDTIIICQLCETVLLSSLTAWSFGVCPLQSFSSLHFTLFHNKFHFLNEPQSVCTDGCYSRKKSLSMLDNVYCETWTVKKPVRHQKLKHLFGAEILIFDQLVPSLNQNFPISDCFTLALFHSRLLTHFNTFPLFCKMTKGFCEKTCLYFSKQFISNRVSQLINNDFGHIEKKSWAEILSSSSRPFLFYKICKVLKC